MPAASLSAITTEGTAMGFTPLQDRVTKPLSVADIADQEDAAHLLPLIGSIHGQESNAGANSRTSVDGARGGMQILPATFKAFAKPGESIDNPDDNMRVGVRYLKHLGDKFENDPAKVATAYFSGEGNVNTGNGSAWKADHKDGNGKRVSAYVSDILGRLSPVGNAQASEPVRGRFTPLDETTPSGRSGFTPIDAVAPKSGFTPLEDENALSLKNNPLTAIGEAGLNLASQVVSVPASGLAGLATAAGKAIGITDKNPVDVIGEVGETLTYQPRTAMGKTATEVVQYPFEKLAEGGNWVGRKVQDATDSAILATAADTAVNALPMLIGPGIKAAKGRNRTESPRPGFTPDEPQQPSRPSEPMADVFNGATEPGMAAAQEKINAQNQHQPQGNRTGTRPAADEAFSAADEQKRAAQAVAEDMATGRIERTQPDPTASLSPEDALIREAQHTRLSDPSLTMEHQGGDRVNIGRSSDLGQEMGVTPDGRLEAVTETKAPPAIAAAEQSPLDIHTSAPMLDNMRQAKASEPAIAAPVMDRFGNVDHPTTHVADNIVSGLAEQHGIPREFLLPEKREPAAAKLVDQPHGRFTPLEATEQPRSGFTPLESVRESGDMPTNGTVNSWAPGANYVGFIDDTPRPGGALPAPDTLQAPKSGARAEPLRREDILIDFAKALNTGIYEGRIAKKGVMGFFRPAREEVRIKRHADLETAAHEMAHLMDSRIPEIRKSWQGGEGGAYKVRREELKGLSYDSGKVYEGFAEFVRHYMTQPDVAKAKAPHFTQWFEDFMSKHEYGPAIENARKGMMDWFGQDALDRARSKIGKHRPMNEALDNRWDSFRQATVDDLHGIYRMERDLSGKIQPNGAYESARLSRASTSIADGALRYGAPVKKADGSFGWKGKGLEEILKPVAENLDDALLYFVGRSSRELMAQNREHLFTRGEIKAMVDLHRPEFDQAFKEYQAWNEAVLDFAEAQGVINPAARHMWQRLEYMPFHRIGQPGGFKGKPGDWTGVKALTGGTENLRDILTNMTSNAAMLIDKAVKNEARTKIADLSEQAKGGKFMVKIPAESRPVKIGKEAVIDAILKSMGIDRATNMAPEVVKIENRLRKLFNASPEMIDMLQTNMPPAGGNVVAVLKGGKPTWYEVNDPVLLRALEAIDRQPPPWIVKWLGLPKRVGQAAITLTPDFMLANIARDTIAGSVMSQHGFVPIVDSLRGMAMRMRQDPLYKDFIANGGGMASIYLDEAKFRAKLEKFYNKQGIDYRTVLDTPNKLLGFVETLGDAFEMSTRLGEYRRAVEAGEHPRHAAYVGREVSTDFAMRGDSKALGFMYDTVMFLKPALLSWDRLYRGLAHDQNRGAIATKAGLMALSSSMLYLLNRGNPLYEQLPDWDKDANWHFFVGDQHFRYPKIWEIGAMASMAERGTAAIIDKDPKGMGKDFARILANTYSVNLTPQIIAPLAEQLANKHFFSDTPIETESMQNLQPFMRAKENTSETLKRLGMATRDLPEALQVNPVRAEALLRGYFNTWATYGLMLTDKALMEKNAPTMRTDQLPVVRRFYQQEPAQHTKYETMFYDLLGEARRVHGTIRELDKTGRSEIADEIERNPLARENHPLEAANKHLQVIQADMRGVRRDDRLSPDEKRQKLDGLIAERNTYLKKVVEESLAVRGVTR